MKLARTYSYWRVSRMWTRHIGGVTAGKIAKENRMFISVLSRWFTRYLKERNQRSIISKNKSKDYG